MFRFFKDFCVLMDFVTKLHPWAIDYAARSNIKWDEDRTRELFESYHERDLIKARIQEIKEKDNET